MCDNPLTDPSFYALLLRLDRAIAEETRDDCPHCGAPLHRGDYPRKPRGIPPGLGPKWPMRFSFCCSREGCRSRLTPFTVRFLARKVYVGAVVVLVSLGRDGVTPQRLRRLRERTGLSLRTIGRWLEWWREAFPNSRFWIARRGTLAGAIDSAALPCSLLERFAGALRERLRSLLEFLLPITSRSAPGALAL